MAALAQTLSTTTVQGAVYLANGAPGSGTLQVSWPAFTTSSNQAVAAGKLTATIGADGFVSVNLAPNLGSSPAGLYYTAIYHMSDGTTNIEYCRNAASTLQQAAASASALWSGTYKCARVSLDADVWPGDALDINVPSAGLNAQVIIRSVTLNYRASLPDAVQYTIRFANDWADDLAIRTSPAVPADVWLPAPISPSYALNVSGLTVVSLTAGSITINTGTPSPECGGFEIRRRDNCFAPGTDSDLVMRSAQPNMTFSRLSAWDRFYVRAYDGANPPNYSEFSAALIFNIPLGW
ncbi:MAG: hypothetical protein ACXVZX_13570 [Terriglobales bacterium]